MGFVRPGHHLASKGPGPEVVAGVASRIVASRKARLRDGLTCEATLFSFLRWLLLPAGAFEAGIRSGFNLDKERVPARVARAEVTVVDERSSSGRAVELGLRR